MGVSEAIPNIYLAPFQGVTGVAFRKVYTKYFTGIDKLFTPFFTGAGHKLTEKQLYELGEPTNNGIQVIPQVLSKDAGEIVHFASMCRAHGFDEINWNLGCPYPQVANKKRGSGMLPYPEMVLQILESVFPRIETGFSIKCRLGYHAVNEFEQLIPVFNQFPLTELIVHPRIGRQLYAGAPDYTAFARMHVHLAAPLAYNGDIFSVEDFRTRSTDYPDINHWMIGRGLLANPFLPAEIKDYLIGTDRKQLIHKFIDELYFAYRKQTNDRLSALGLLKEYWSYLSLSFADSHQVFKHIKTAKNFDDYEDAVKWIFEEFEWVRVKTN